jgi:hypothetical protein
MPKWPTLGQGVKKSFNLKSRYIKNNSNPTPKIPKVILTLFQNVQNSLTLGPNILTYFNMSPKYPKLILA